MVTSVSCPTAETTGIGECGNGARDGFFVERPEIFERTAAARDDSDLRPASAAEVFEAAANVFDGAGALHTRGEEADVKSREAARKDFDEIANDGAFGRGHDADAEGKARQRPFSRGFEKAFFEEFLFELFKGELKRALALRLDGFDDELVFAALFVDIDAAAHEDLHAVLRLEFQAPVRELPADAFDLRVGVLKREVAVAAGHELRAGDFAGDPDVGEAAVERGADAVAQFAQGEDAAFGDEAEGVLFHQG